MIIGREKQINIKHLLTGHSDVLVSAYVIIQTFEDVLCLLSYDFFLQLEIFNCQVIFVSPHYTETTDRLRSLTCPPNSEEGDELCCDSSFTHCPCTHRLPRADHSAVFSPSHVHPQWAESHKVNRGEIRTPPASNLSQTKQAGISLWL